MGDTHHYPLHFPQPQTVSGRKQEKLLTMSTSRGIWGADGGSCLVFLYAFLYSMNFFYIDTNYLFKACLYICINTFVCTYKNVYIYIYIHMHTRFK